MCLAKAGVPWDVIMGMDDTERRGFCIAAGMADGNKFDWNMMSWKN